ADRAPDHIYLLSLHDALPIWNVQRHVDWPGRQGDRLAMRRQRARCRIDPPRGHMVLGADNAADSRRAVARRDIEVTPRSVRPGRSEEHTSELQSRGHLVCRLL